MGSDQRFTVRRQNNPAASQGIATSRLSFRFVMPRRRPIRLLFCCRIAASLRLLSYLRARRSRNFRSAVLVINPTFVMNPHLRKVNYDPVTSFEPICYLVNAPTVIIVNDASPYRTLADLLDAARAKPGDLTLAGSAGMFYIAFEMLKRAANLNMTFVPYPGGAPAVTALLGEHVTSMFTDYPTLAEQLKAGVTSGLNFTQNHRFEFATGVAAGAVE